MKSIGKYEKYEYEQWKVLVWWMANKYEYEQKEVWQVWEWAVESESMSSRIESMSMIIRKYKYEKCKYEYEQ